MAKAVHRIPRSGRWRAELCACELRLAGHFNHQTSGAHHDNHNPVHTEVVAGQMAETCPAETEIRKQEGPTGPAHAVEAKPLNDLFPGRQSCRLQGLMAAVIQTRMKNAECRTESPRKAAISRSSFRILSSALGKGAANETGHSISKLRDQTKPRSIGVVE